MTQEPAITQRQSLRREVRTSSFGNQTMVSLEEAIYRWDIKCWWKTEHDLQLNFE